MKKLNKLASDLRKRPTEAEKVLWNYLKSRQMEGFKFRRQQPIDNYIVDFVCFENRLVIEVDGGQHAEDEKDRERDAYIKKYGFKVLRFWNNEVLKNIDGVLEVIRESCLSHLPLTPPLLGESSTVKGGENERDTFCRGGGKVTRGGLVV